MKENIQPSGRPISRHFQLLRNTKPKVLHRLYFNVGLISLAAFSVLVVCYPTDSRSSVGSEHVKTVFNRLMRPATPGDAPLKHWNHSRYSFEPRISDWDEQRGKSLNVKKENGTEGADHESLGVPPRTLMVTSTSPVHCQPAIFSHMLLRAMKNKVDYSRMHGVELYYSMGNHNEDFSDWWVKLPLIRMLMLQHPEYEWIWWVDADSIFTNMTSPPPFQELGPYNLVLQGDDYRLFRLRHWRAISTSNFMIRNNQWSLDLLDAWASMGTASRRDKAGAFLTEVLTERPSELTADDQSALVYLLLEDSTREDPSPPPARVPKVKLVQDSEFILNGDWRTVGPNLENWTSGGDPGLPFVTHFDGCLPSCSANSEYLAGLLEATDCQKQLERTFDFADNQVYGQFGFLPRPLGNDTATFLKDPKLITPQEPPKTVHDYKMEPPITDWDEKRQAWLRKHPPQKSNHVLLVSGSAPHPCKYQPASNLLLRGLKNRIDFCRKHEYEFFYNMVNIDEGLTGWWIKLPLLKLMMLNNPQAEWVWWMDSDAILTDMDFQFPFEKYNSSGFNFALYGSDHEVYERKSWTGINTGDVLIRNCQESLDMLDRWASISYTPELRHENVHILTEVLLDRTDGWDVDDQSVFAYLLIAEKDKWKPKVCLEGDYTMSGEWTSWTAKFLDGLRIDSADYKPFVTHFAGCHPCQEEPVAKCLVGMERTYSYAENQVLSMYGLTHERLNYTDIQVLDLSRDAHEKSGEEETTTEEKETPAEEGHTSQDESPSKPAEEESKREEKETVAEEVHASQDEPSSKPAEEEIKTAEPVKKDHEKSADRESSPAEESFNPTDGLNVSTGEKGLEKFKADTEASETKDEQKEASETKEEQKEVSETKDEQKEASQEHVES